MAFAVAVATVFALVIPFTGLALASHLGTDNSHDLQVTPEVDTNPTGTTHTLIAYVADCFDAPGNQTCEVDFEIESGPVVTVNRDAGATRTSDADNSPTTPDMTCLIVEGAVDDPATPLNEGTSEACSVSFTSNTQGVNIIRAWVDDDQDNNTFDADQTEGRYAGPTDCTNTGVPGATTDVGAACEPAGATAVPGQRTEVDDTDVVQKTWGQGVTQACIDAEPENDTNPSGTDHEITARVTNGSTFQNGTDDTGSFDCLGTALANTRVVVTITDDTPDIYIKSVNGVSTGGPTAGGPNTFTGTTDANGQLVVVIACVSGAVANCSDGAANPNTGNLIELAVEGASAGPNNAGTSGPGACTATTTACDRVEKHWQQAGNATELDATPETDVNEVGQTHVITCRSTDAFGTGVAGTNCDAQVTGGTTGNQGRDLDNNALTPLGYIGDCNTAADGTCTVSYTSTVVGQDTITVWNDLNGDDDQVGDAGETDATAPGTTQDVITKDWVAVGQGTQDVDIDMENTAAGTANCDGLADGTDDVNDEKSATNNINTAHEVCAERFGPTGERDPGPVTFRIVSGPGSLFVDTDGDGVRDANEPLRTGSVTVQEDSCGPGGPAGAGFNCVGVTSSTAGTTTIEACSEGSTTLCDTATKTWTGGAARTVACTPETATNPTGTEHTFICTVLDRFGNPVGGESVTLTLSGVGGFSDPSCFSAQNRVCTLLTAGDGTVRTRITTAGGEEGTSTLTAELTRDVADADTSFDTDDACDQAAGNLSDEEGDNSDNDADNQATNAGAGDCEDTATKVWDDEEPPEPLTRGRCSGFAPGTRTPRPSGGFVIVGTPANDVLDGSGGADLICGLGGDDIIAGAGSSDIITGNGGNDNIKGGGGKDNITGNAGDDVISGNKGNDSIKGNGGNDALKGNSGIDTLSGGAGNDTLQGGDNEDILKGNDGNDTLRGGDGDDALDGGDGRDQCFGNQGDDSVRRCE